MNPALIAISTALALLAGAIPAAHAASAMLASGGDAVQALHDALLSTMKNGRSLGQSGRLARLQPVMRKTSDLATMSRLSVGPFWATLTETRRRQVAASFGRYISAIYADRFDSYSGQKLLVTGAQPAGAAIIVGSEIVKANDEAVKVDYLMRRNGDSWLISDIYPNGAISEVAIRRSEFAATIKNGAAPAWSRC